MQMEHGLAGAGAVVHVEAEILQPFLFGNPACHQQQVAKQALVALFGIRQLGDGLLGDYQEVGGRLGVNIPEGQALVVFKDDIGGNLAIDDLGKRVSAMVRIAPDRQGRAVFRPEVCAPVHSSHGNCG